jgi:hypothetical protein
MKIILLIFVYLCSLNLVAQSNMLVKKAIGIIDLYEQAIGGKNKWKNITSFVDV